MTDERCVYRVSEEALCGEPDARHWNSLTQQRSQYDDPNVAPIGDHLYTAGRRCEVCGGSGMALVRMGHAYEHFDQSDYDVVPCPANCDDGWVSTGS